MNGPAIADAHVPACPPPAGRLTGELARHMAGALAWLLLSVALLLAWRRLAGALAEPPQPRLLLAAGALAAALAGLVRLPIRPAQRDRNAPCAEPALGRHGRLVARWLPSVALAALGAALTFRGTPMPVQASFWALLLLEEAWSLRSTARPAAQRNGGKSGTAGDPERRLEAGPPQPIHRPAATLPPPAAIAEVPEEDIVQQLTRSRGPDGRESLTGCLRLAFAPGQRTASAHLAFCPPFPRTPQLAVEQADGPAARIKTAQLLPYGARLDLKLVSASEKPEQVLLEFSARSKAEEGE
jgi:membrane protein implicated in regulation of membrane protease activity